MVEFLTLFPDNVLAFAAKGRVTRKDYEVIESVLEQALRRPGKIRCYYELGPEFAGMDSGALWEDFKIGMGHLTRWERVAVVTDVDWIRHSINLFRFLVPGDFRVFPTSQASEARLWITAA
jgi:hypothetical protein